MNSSVAAPVPVSIDALVQFLQEVGYFADRRLATAVFLALRLQRPLLLEGEPGVGKTALAQALSKVLARSLIRLQCYDGLEQREALYEWNYAAQLLHMRAAELSTPTLGTGVSSLPPEGALAALGRPGGGSAVTTAGALRDIEAEVYQDRYLIRRPLLQALQAPAPGAVLLIDEVDRADEPFEAFLLEYLGEYQVSIPEIGTVRATATPVTILTSNRTRDLHDAVKRRCLYHWLDYPERERELAIVRAQVPGASAALAQQVADFVGRLRSQPFANAFQRAPGIAESVEWAKALVALDTIVVDPEVVSDTAGILFKQREDVAALTRDMAVQLLQPVDADA
ncbi:MAG: MoxR family ATPase [Acidovorax soli]|uniref:AAA family ATPase n=1 Tax=Acidovorax soli TaxID=592050 RepID=UPI0026E9C2E8|nr:MoxR family ATPase [Acidovorax soli]MCM2348196.1 MoxR family ATPase [Acidovorax soli]